LANQNQTGLVGLPVTVLTLLIGGAWLWWVK
jgi:hypothetical protein